VRDSHVAERASVAQGRRQRRTVPRSQRARDRTAEPRRQHGGRRSRQRRRKRMPQRQHAAVSPEPRLYRDHAQRRRRLSSNRAAGMVATFGRAWATREPVPTQHQTSATGSVAPSSLRRLGRKRDRRGGRLPSRGGLTALPGCVRGAQSGRPINADRSEALLNRLHR